MPPISRGGAAKRGKGKLTAVKSQSILSFFAAPARPLVTPTSPLGNTDAVRVVASDIFHPVDLTDDSGGGNTPMVAGLPPVAPTAVVAESGGSDTGFSRTSPSGGTPATDSVQGLNSGSVVFVRASSLSCTRASATTTSTAGAKQQAPGLSAACQQAAGNTRAGSVPSSPAPSWGSLGRQQRTLPPSNGRSRVCAKVITLPLHVVGLQFRESSNNGVWSSPTTPTTTPAASSPPSPPGQAHCQQQPATPAISPNDSVRGNTALELEREPCNAHDRNAIKVLLPATPQTKPPVASQSFAPSRFIGYIPGRIAVLLAPVLDAAPGTVARVSLRSVEEEGESEGGGGVGAGNARNTLPALLVVHPLDGAGKEPYLGLMEKLRDAAKKEAKRQQKRRSEAKANTDRLRSKQKTLLLDFGRSSGATAKNDGSTRGGAILESMPWEVLWQVFCSPGISSRELFGPIRGVCGNWMRAVDAMPCAHARREVARVCAGQQPNSGERARQPENENGEKGDGELESSPLPKASRGGGIGRGEEARGAGKDEGGGGGGGGGGGDGGDEKGYHRGKCWWDTVRARLVRGGGFTECAVEDIFARLEWAIDQDIGEDILEDDQEGDGDHPDGGGEGAVEDGDGDGDGGQIQIGNGGAGEGICGKRGRMLRHLDATRALCREWDLLGGGATAAAAGSGGGGSWSGWEAVGLAIATSASQDRLSLCCWVIRPLMGGDASDSCEGARGQRRRAPSCPGLPRGEVIELLCLMLCALRSVGDGLGGEEGSVRLRADLLMCARVLENRDVRFQKPGRPGGGGGGGGASGLISNLTSEQRSIVLADVKPGGVLTVLAFAGTGKTTCLRAYAQARPHLKILYLTFNVSVRQEAEKTFPPHVACKGVHQLAFRFVGRRFRLKLTEDLRETHVQAFLKDRLGKEVKINLATAARVLSTLNAFFSSDSPALSASHVGAPPPELLSPLDCGGGGGDDEDGEDSGSDEHDNDGGDVDGGGGGGGSGHPSRTSSHPAAALPSSPPSPRAAAANSPGPKRKCRRGDSSPVDEATILEWASMAWAEMQCTEPPRHPRGEGGSGEGDGDGEGRVAVSLGMTHAGYLKLFQLSRPCLGRTYDVIMLDEAQDSNPCIASIVLRETGCARILVGDSHQAIYGFIGAEDHLKRVEGGKVRHLTQVFRFDQSIAHVANSLVGSLKGETRPLLGCAGKKGQVVLASETGLEVWRDMGCRVKRPMAFLARTVSTLVHAAILAKSRGEKIAWVGGAQAYSLEAIEDICLMAMGRSVEVRHPLLIKLKTIKKLINFTRESGDRQWASRLRVLDGTDPRTLLSDLRELQRKQVHPREADTILSTVHKAKGLEFDTVVLADDFIEVDDIRWTDEPNPEPVWSSEAEKEEVNILYVAVTRAKRRLVVNSSLRAFLANTGAWDSVSLRGVAGVSAASAGVRSSRCALCGRCADSGGGGDRVERLSRARAAAKAEQAAGGSGFSYTGETQPVRGGGLLYAESGSLRPLCCWCVEGLGGGGDSDMASIAAAGAGGAAAAIDAAVGPEGPFAVLAAWMRNALSSRFPYARDLMRGASS